MLGDDAAELRAQQVEDICAAGAAGADNEIETPFIFCAQLVCVVTAVVERSHCSAIYSVLSPRVREQQA